MRQSLLVKAALIIIMLSIIIGGTCDNDISTTFNIDVRSTLLSHKMLIYSCHKYAPVFVGKGSINNNYVKHYYWRDM